METDKREVNWHTAYITVFNGVDSFGRVMLCAQWMDDCIGHKRDETGLRGQFFRFNLAEFTESWKAKGWDVEFCDQPLERKVITFPPVPDERGRQLRRFPRQ